MFCAIGRFEYPYAYPALSAKLYRDLLSLDYDDSAPPVRISSDVWVGEKAIVLEGGAVTARSSQPASWSPRTSRPVRS